MAVPAASRAQQPDTARVRADVSGAVTVTTKGISTIPTFTLGEPAAIFDLAIRRGALGFEPQLRYGLDGKPWSFLFWGRWRAFDARRWHLALGAHPALSFRKIQLPDGVTTREAIVARRYLASEVVPTYAVSRSTSVGAYWLYSRGLGSDVTRNTNYFALRAGHVLRFPRGVSLRLAPQAYYLKLDQLDGTYASGAATLSWAERPVSLSSSATRKLRTDIAGDAFIWNVSLTYSID